MLALAVGIALTASQFVLHRADSRPSVPAKETALAATAVPVPAGTPTAVAPPTSDPAASTATGTAVLPVSEQIAVQERAFNASRARLVTGLPREMSQSVTSVDRLDFDPGRPTIVAQITSPLTIESSLHDTAWAVTQALVVYWSLETVRRAPNAVPDLRISVNNLRIECPAGVMVRLGYGEASREQWAAECKPAG